MAKPRFRPLLGGTVLSASMLIGVMLIARSSTTGGCWDRPLGSCSVDHDAFTWIVKPVGIYLGATPLMVVALFIAAVLLFALIHSMASSAREKPTSSFSRGILLGLALGMVALFFL